MLPCLLQQGEKRIGEKWQVESGPVGGLLNSHRLEHQYGFPIEWWTQQKWPGLSLPADMPLKRDGQQGNLPMGSSGIDHQGRVYRHKKRPDQARMNLLHPGTMQVRGTGPSTRFTRGSHRAATIWVPVTRWPWWRSSNHRQRENHSKVEGGKEGVQKINPLPPTPAPSGWTQVSKEKWAWNSMWPQCFKPRLWICLRCHWGKQREICHRTVTGNEWRFKTIVSTSSNCSINYSWAWRIRENRLENLMWGKTHGILSSLPYPKCAARKLPLLSLAEWLPPLVEKHFSPNL